MEPFKIKTVEPINFLLIAERQKELLKAGYNLFKVPADRVTVDLLTDSGTGALSENQWSMLMLGDESYAGAKSWKRFEKSVREFTGKKYVIPVHQGRAAEKLLAELFLKTPGDCVVSNTLFDTTRANFEHAGAVCLDFPESSNLSSNKKFKGNIHVGRVEKFIKKNAARVCAMVLTLTNNANGGQPVSFSNVRASATLAKKRHIPLVIDACRIAENAYFIKKDEGGLSKLSIGEIVKKSLAAADIVFMSAKKDGLANIGGFLATNNKDYAKALTELGILYEGFSNYGGMSGREMETVAQGLKEVVDEKYLAHRTEQVAYLHGGLSEIGFKLSSPPGGHAVYVDAEVALPHIKKENFPAHALTVAFYAEGGVRGVEIGSLMFGGVARNELVRLAIPRRVYTVSHLDHVIETARDIWKTRRKLKGFRVVSAPRELRHFSARLKPIG